MSQCRHDVIVLVLASKPSEQGGKMKTYRYTAPFTGLVGGFECENCGDDYAVHNWVKTQNKGIENPAIDCDRV